MTSTPSSPANPDSQAAPSAEQEPSLPPWVQQTNELKAAGYRYTLGWHPYEQFFGTLIAPDGTESPYGGCWSPAEVIDCMHYQVFHLPA